MRLRYGVDDAPEPMLARPAKLVTSGTDDEQSAVHGTPTPVRRERMVGAIAKQAKEPGEKAAAQAHLPVTQSARERRAGVFVEAYTDKHKRTHYRAVRTEAMGDEPLPKIAYRTSDVQR